MRWNYDGITATLRAEAASHPPIVVLKNETEDRDRKEIL